MDFDQDTFDRAISAPLAIWAACSAAVILFLISSMRRNFDLIRIGFLMTYLSWTFALAMGAYDRLLDKPPLIESAPLVVWIMASIGAVGSVVVIKGFLRKE